MWKYLKQYWVDIVLWTVFISCVFCAGIRLGYLLRPPPDRMPIIAFKTKIVDGGFRAIELKLSNPDGKLRRVILTCSSATTAFNQQLELTPHITRISTVMISSDENWVCWLDNQQQERVKLVRL